MFNNRKYVRFLETSLDHVMNNNEKLIDMVKEANRENKDLVMLMGYYHDLCEKNGLFKDNPEFPNKDKSGEGE